MATPAKLNRTVKLRNGVTVPALGQGTWYLGDNARTHDAELAALRAGIEAGMTLLDTAEMYGDGRSEMLLGEAIKPYNRENLFIVSKVLPGNAKRGSIERSLNDSMERIGVDYLDLYLYHWRGGTPLSETVDCLEMLKKSGKIHAWGVSNFDITDMQELFEIPGGQECLVNQVLYNLSSRGIEFSLLPWMRNHGVALMAYCPLAQGGRLHRGLFKSHALKEVAAKHFCGMTQALLAWDIRDGKTIAIPRTGNTEHTLLNARAALIKLDEKDLKMLDNDFCPPTCKEPLDIQ